MWPGVSCATAVLCSNFSIKILFSCVSCKKSKRKLILPPHVRVKKHHASTAPYAVIPVIHNTRHAAMKLPQQAPPAVTLTSTGDDYESADCQLPTALKKVTN